MKITLIVRSPVSLLSDNHSALFCWPHQSNSWSRLGRLLVSSLLITSVFDMAVFRSHD